MPVNIWRLCPRARARLKDIVRVYVQWHARVFVSVCLCTRSCDRLLAPLRQNERMSTVDLNRITRQERFRRALPT